MRQARQKGQSVVNKVNRQCALVRRELCDKGQHGMARSMSWARRRQNWRTGRDVPWGRGGALVTAQGCCLLTQITERVYGDMHGTVQREQTPSSQLPRVGVFRKRRPRRIRAVVVCALPCLPRHPTVLLRRSPSPTDVAASHLLRTY